MATGPQPRFSPPGVETGAAVGGGRADGWELGARAAFFGRPTVIEEFNRAFYAQSLQLARIEGGHGSLSPAQKGAWGPPEERRTHSGRGPETSTQHSASSAGIRFAGSRGNEGWLSNNTSGHRFGSATGYFRRNWERTQAARQFIVDWYGGGLMGAAAFVDGLNPFGSPLEEWGLYDSRMYGLHRSHAIGMGSFDTLLSLTITRLGFAVGRGAVPTWSTDSFLTKFTFSQVWTARLFVDPHASRAWQAALAGAGTGFTGLQVGYRFYYSPNRVISRWRDPER